jgi:hypothetical protein
MAPQIMQHRIPLSLKLVIAQFVRLMTNDRPEAVHFAGSHLAPKHFGPLYDLPDGLDILSVKEYHIVAPSLKLVLGGISTLLPWLTIDIVVNIAEAYLSEKVAPPEQLTAIIRNAKNRFMSLEIQAELSSDDPPSEDLLSCLRTLSSIATYLDSYLEIYPETTPSENKDTEMDESDPFEDEEMEVDDNEKNLPSIETIVLTELLASIPLILKQQLSIPVIPHALETINDIAWTMTVRMPEWEQWKTIAQQLLEFTVPRIQGMLALGDETATAFLGCIWAAAKNLPGTFSLDADDIQLLEKLYAQSTSTELRAKVIGILSLAAQTDSIETNQYITKFMMQGITSQIPLVVVEVIDALMEVFADGDKAYDKPVFVEGQLLPTLKQMLPKLRKLVKTIDARKETDLRERADDVLENFTEFLKYKEDEAKAK